MTECELKKHRNGAFYYNQYSDLYFLKYFEIVEEFHSHFSNINLEIHHTNAFVLCQFQYANQIFNLVQYILVFDIVQV